MRTTTFSRRRLMQQLLRCLACSVGGTAAVTTAALAQTDGSREVLEEILVTAQKRSENIQDVPISLTALSGEDLEKKGAAGFADYARSVPSLAFSDQGASRSQLVIRGVTTGPVRRDDPVKTETVGVYVDDVPVSVALYNPDLDLFDVSRVEILRGPQGTLYGAGSLSGTIRVVTNAPDPNHLEARALSSISSTRDGGMNWAGKAMVNLPLVEDRLGLRVAGYYTSADGFIDDIGRGRDDVNGVVKYGGRIAARFTPNDRLTITPRIVVQKTESDGYPYEDVELAITNPPNGGSAVAIGSGRYDQFRQVREGLSDEFKLVSVQVDYDLGGPTLTSVSSYLDRDLAVNADFTSFMQSIFVGAPFANGVPPTTVIDLKSPRVLAEELRLTSSTDGRFDWIVGAFWSDQQQDYSQVIPSPGFTAATGLPTAPFGGEDILFRSFFDLSQRQLALFGEGKYEITPTIAATLGLRWYDVDESYSNRDEGFLPGRISDTTSTAASEDGLNPKLLISYQPTEDALLSLQASRGFRLGGPNQTPALSGPASCLPELQALGLNGAPPPAESETLWNYEAGFKTAWADRRLIVNGAVYHIDYRDLQVATSLNCGYVITQNAGKARSRGVELELTARPVDGLQFTIGGAYTDATLSTDLPGGAAQAGERLPFVPRHSLNAGVTYTWPVMTDGGAMVDVGYQRVGESVSFFNRGVSADPTGNVVPEHSLVQLRVGLQAGRWEVSAFVDNLLDERAPTSIDRLRPGYQANGEALLRSFSVTRPRTIGVSVAVQY